MTPDPTDAELDEWEQDITALIAQRERRYSVHPTAASRLIKALRACRQQSKAKDAVIEAARPVAVALPLIDDLARLSVALAVLDKEVDDGNTS